jgi:shikimate kinase
VSPVVVLVGAPGAGKTTVGAALADALGVAFRDTDSDVEAAAGKPVGEIFVDDGEPAFRALERTAVATALADHEGVLAVGGGAILDPTTRARLDGQRVVLLDVGLADAARRVGLNRDRPLLLGNPRAQLAALLDARRPVYAEVATDVVDTSGRGVDEVVAAVRDLLAGKPSG